MLMKSCRYLPRRFTARQNVHHYIPPLSNVRRSTKPSDVYYSPTVADCVGVSSRFLQIRRSLFTLLQRSVLTPVYVRLFLFGNRRRWSRVLRTRGRNNRKLREVMFTQLLGKTIAETYVFTDHPISTKFKALNRISNKARQIERIALNREAYRVS